jgi:O-acetyl-ADP-ribose deacetylase
MEAKVNRVNIRIIQGNLLALSVEVAVVVTDPNLTVSPELAALAGDVVRSQTAAIGWCEVGSAVMTEAGRLEGIDKIIHAIGPRWGEGSERGKLSNVTWQCLSLAETNRLRSIALPAISTGTLGYPLEGCAKVMITRIIDFTFENLRSLRSVILCLENAAAVSVFQAEFHRQIEVLKETGEGRVRA